MCLVRPLSDAERRAAAKLHEDADRYTAIWEARVAKRAESFGLAGDALHEFCDLASVP